MHQRAAGSKKSLAAFTLIELMIVVSIIGILAMIAIPKFASLERRADESTSLGNLGTIRSALSIYFGAMEGAFPSDLAALTVGGRYLQALPQAKAPRYHPAAAAVAEAALSDDAGGWLYDNVAGTSGHGSVWIDCTHTDTRQTTWSTY